MYKLNETGTAIVKSGKVYTLTELKNLLNKMDLLIKSQQELNELNKDEDNEWVYRRVKRKNRRTKTV